MIDQKVFEINRNFHGVKGLIFIGDKILVYRRDNKTEIFPLHIDLPGGGKEGRESAFETFKREVKEEFGLDIDEQDVIYAKQYMSAMDPTKETYFIVTKPLDIKEEQIVFGDEGLEFFLIDPYEYVELGDGIKRQQDKTTEYLETLK